ncbi:RlpA-like double-psi beta-barrel-protein domain-containing protein-containing protein [Vararia minispora EC-137]|uniref:RlpA-like double-psi beta-barrel-protein domain-containing protein-containing protein n=1 Tax=Vararia minispora EC-137 TaxID=1314806 RepID=A0ACB8QLJ9_9AGAM|nr:RlpA-like double-psi beta-barrel-protein domain-containing protein-containing protein [Vararia minispora EC-137]
MFRLSIFLLALLSFFSAVMSAPIPEPVTVEIELEKRTTHTGRGTFYYVGLGNCGWTNTNSEHVVAMSKAFYDVNKGGNCGQTLTITWGGKTETATMVDSCPGCGYYDLDMSPSLFQKFAAESVGVLNGVNWHFNAK